MTHKPISASSLKRWQLCARLWAYERDSEARQEGAAQKLGKEVHAWLEAYLRTTDRPDVRTPAAKIALKILPDLHALGVRRGDPGLRLEEHVQWDDHDDPAVTWHGYPDVTFSLPSGTVTVVDYKTTKNPTAYAMDESALAEDPQRILYAASTGKDTRSVWLYVGTGDQGGAHSVEWAETADETRERLRKLLPIAREIMAHANSPPRTLPRSPESCEAFGGCRHFIRCWATDWSEI